MTHPFKVGDKVERRATGRKYTVAQVGVYAPSGAPLIQHKEDKLWGMASSYAFVPPPKPTYQIIEGEYGTSAVSTNEERCMVYATEVPDQSIRHAMLRAAMTVAGYEEQK